MANVLNTMSLMRAPNRLPVISFENISSAVRSATVPIAPTSNGLGMRNAVPPILNHQ